MPSVAIIGAGPQGLTLLKNLLEEDFEATVYERRSMIGGLWRYTEDMSQPCIMESTVGNISKYRNCFTDFPCPEDVPVHMNGKETMEYLESYADHFGLRKHIQLNTDVKQVARSADDKSWDLTIQHGGGQENQCFDKIIFATGRIEKPHIPLIGRMDSFVGRVLHSQAFKHPEEFAGKRVLLIGAGNTAADIASDLVGIADKIYVSHRGGQNILSRWVNGVPLDLSSNRQKTAIVQLILYLASKHRKRLLQFVWGKIAESCYKLDPAWGFTPAPFILTHSPLITDTFVDHLRSGAIQSVSGIRRVAGPTPESVELDDGTTIGVDALIFCTGYRSSFSLWSEQLTGQASAISNPSSGTKHMSRAPRLYKNIFPPTHADSVAFVNNWQTSDGIFDLGDLVAMAIAQIWKGSFSLPSREGMEREVDRHQQWARSMCNPGEEPPSYLINKEPWLAWLHEAAGTSVNENLGYGWQGWRFYLSDRKFCSLLMTGLDSPHVFRLFDGRRKKWPGAQDAILRANEDLKRQKEKREHVQNLSAVNTKEA